MRSRFLSLATITALVVSGLFGLTVGAAATEGPTEIAQLVAGNPQDGARFGFSVAVSDDIIVVGTPGEDSELGAAYVYQNSNGILSQVARLQASNREADDKFGTAVAVSGDTIVIGSQQAPNGGTLRGKAWAFSRPAGGWQDATEDAVLTAPSPANFDFFGAGVATSGDTIVVAMLQPTSGPGAVFVYERTGATWQAGAPVAQLTGSDAVSENDFANSVAMTSDTIVVGGEEAGGSDQGQAYVFERPGSGWTDASENAILSASDGAAYDEFGDFVAVDSDTIVVGAQNHNNASLSNSGAAYVFTRAAGGWQSGTQTAKLTDSNPADGDEFGDSVGVSGDTIVVGAPRIDLSGSDRGAMFLFTKPASGWVDASQPPTFSASDGVDSQQFGYESAISQGLIVIGTPYLGAGKAYVYATPPGAPTNLSAVPGVGSARVSFTPGPDNGSPIVRYEYQIDGGAWTAFDPPATGSPVSVPGLTGGVAVSIRLRAVNVAGPGVASEPVTVVPNSPTPSPTPTPTPSPTPKPTPKTTLRVAATDGVLRVDRRQRLARASTNGRITGIRTECLLKGNRLRGRDARALCGFTVKERRSRAVISAAPSCTRGLRLTVVVRARVAGAPAKNWSDTWRVGGPATRCVLPGTG